MSDTVGHLSRPRTDFEQLGLVCETVAMRRDRPPPTKSEEEYEIQEVIDFGTRNDYPLYLIHWKGYDDPSDWTWEPVAGLGKVAPMIHKFNAQHGIKLASCYMKLLEPSHSDDDPSTDSAAGHQTARSSSQAGPAAAAYSQMVFQYLFPDVVRSDRPDEAGEVSVMGTLKLNDELHFHCRSASGRRMWIPRTDMVRDHADAVITWYETLLGAG